MVQALLCELHNEVHRLVNSKTIDKHKPSVKASDSKHHQDLHDHVKKIMDSHKYPSKSKSADHEQHQHAQKIMDAAHKHLASKKEEEKTKNANSKIPAHDLHKDNKGLKSKTSDHHTLNHEHSGHAKKLMEEAHHQLAHEKKKLETDHHQMAKDLMNTAHKHADSKQKAKKQMKQQGINHNNHDDLHKHVDDYLKEHSEKREQAKRHYDEKKSNNHHHWHHGHNSHSHHDQIHHHHDHDFHSHGHHDHDFNHHEFHDHHVPYDHEMDKAAQKMYKELGVRHLASGKSGKVSTETTNHLLQYYTLSLQTGENCYFQNVTKDSNIIIDFKQTSGETVLVKVFDPNNKIIVETKRVFGTLYATAKLDGPYHVCIYNPYWSTRKVFMILDVEPLDLGEHYKTHDQVHFFHPLNEILKQTRRLRALVVYDKTRWSMRNYEETYYTSTMMNRSWYMLYLALAIYFYKWWPYTKCLAMQQA
uniref:histidine-rich glycoprotein isoform X2 n=1 Tax=Ciona intestinalis TaxID=7719 RepID=UPI000180C2DB|nr:histidine-rich glycoprotein isoform X2 [Ciona intestinalis]|eukprot:XP_002123416.1 histidine-rich glycoprotein isoform X2 [Ciona intestinalis]